jgi:L-ascorbate metabolism protein UlaG (beta-lactamase superfamily)
MTTAAPLAVTRLAHSCHLIEIGGTTVLTDPWFSEKAGYHPGEPLAMTVEELPHLDAVVISHHHYDHCDLERLRRYRDLGVPLIVAEPVAERARKAGFTDVRILRPWESTAVGDLRVTAAPAKHGVYEVTFILQAGGSTAYFAGDTMLIPELNEIADRFPAIDLMLVPTNGLRIRPQFNRQVVMDADEAATLVGRLRPRVAVPHHYAFTSGAIGDRLLTRSDTDPQLFARAARAKAPKTTVHVVPTGQRIVV